MSSIAQYDISLLYNHRHAEGHSKFGFKFLGEYHLLTIAVSAT